MLERIQSLLAGLATPAQLQAVLEAVQVLDEHGFKQCEQIIHEEIALNQYQTGNTIEQITDRRLIPIFRELLESMGITLADGLSLRTLTEVFDAVTRIENFEDKDAVRQLAASDWDSTENLIAILSVVAAKSEEHFAPMIEDASDELLQRIADLADEAINGNGIDPAVYARAKERVRTFLEAHGDAEGAAVKQYFDIGLLTLGVAAETMLTDLREQLEDMSNDAAAATIALIALASDAADEMVVSIAKREVELCFTDLMRAMAVANRVTQLLIRVGYE